MGVQPRDEQAQLRITPWPATPLPLRRELRVMRAALYDVEVTRSDSGRGMVVDPWRGTIVDPWLPPGEERSLFRRRLLFNLVPLGETYLKLAQLDLMDRAAVSAFLETHGPLGTRAMRREFAADVAEAFVVWDEENPSYYGFGPLASDEELASDWWHALLHSQQGDFDPDPYFSMEAMERESMAELGHPDGILNIEYRFGTETLDEFRGAAGLISDAVACWRVARGEIEPSEHCWWMLAEPQASASTVDLSKEFAGDEAPRDGSRRDRQLLALQQAALEGLQAVLGVGLVPFAPRLEIHDPILDAAGAGDVAGQPWLKRLPLFSVCCAELFNHVLESEPYRTCANERCRRLFVRQVGRATKGTRRSSGVLFCSASCARAQAQRAYRQRRRSRGGTVS